MPFSLQSVVDVFSIGKIVSTEALKDRTLQQEGKDGAVVHSHLIRTNQGLFFLVSLSVDDIRDFYEKRYWFRSLKRDLGLKFSEVVTTGERAIFMTHRIDRYFFLFKM